MKIHFLRNTFFVLILTSSAMLSAFSNEETLLSTSETTSSSFDEESDPLFVERLRFRRHRHSDSNCDCNNADGVDGALTATATATTTLEHSRILMQRYISDLNVNLLAIALNTSQTRAILLAYNQDIGLTTGALQRALAAAGAADQAQGVFEALNNFAIKAEGVALAITSIADFFEAGVILANTLTRLSPSIDRKTIDGFVSQLIIDIRDIIGDNGTGNFTGAVQHVNSAQQTGLDLINYLFRNIVSS